MGMDNIQTLHYLQDFITQVYYNFITQIEC